MAGNTKERILNAALDLFSEKGFEGTNLQEIADCVGIVKSALYRHFRSKEEIWDTLVVRMTAYYEEHFGSDAHLPPIPDSAEALAAMTVQMAGFTIRDAQIRKVRKLLLIEQFRNAQARSLATKHFLTGLEAMFTRIFAAMMENGTLKKADPAMLAFAYTTPITALVHLCDREPEKEAQAVEKIRSFAEHFAAVYGA